jgi:hypothetical protein
MSSATDSNPLALPWKAEPKTLYANPLDFPTFEFRLLTLLPPGADEPADGLVHCTLRHDYLIERYDEKTGNTTPIPQYVALSYCWVCY